MAATRTPVPVVGAQRRIGEQLATWRKLRQLTAAQVAERAGISRYTVMRLENGEGASGDTQRPGRALGGSELSGEQQGGTGLGSTGLGSTGLGGTGLGGTGLGGGELADDVAAARRG